MRPVRTRLVGDTLSGVSNEYRAMEGNTISLDDDAYERLDAHRQDGEDFSDAVRRILGGPSIAEYHDVLEEDTADELAAIVERRRNARRERRRIQAERIGDGSSE